MTSQSSKEVKIMIKEMLWWTEGVEDVEKYMKDQLLYVKQMFCINREVDKVRQTVETVRC